MSSGTESRNQDSQGEVHMKKGLWDKYSSAVVSEIQKGRNEGSIVVALEKKGLKLDEASWLVGCVSEKMIAKGLISKAEPVVEMEIIDVDHADDSGRVNFSELVDCEEPGGDDIVSIEAPLVIAAPARIASKKGKKKRMAELVDSNMGGESQGSSMNIFLIVGGLLVIVAGVVLLLMQM